MYFGFVTFKNNVTNAMLTIFITVRTYGSTSSLPWYPIIILSTTTSVSTFLSVLTERFFRLLRSHLSRCLRLFIGLRTSLWIGDDLESHQ